MSDEKLAGQSERAFPSNAINPEFGGMALRDWFAGQALVGIIANGSYQALLGSGDDNPRATIVYDAWCYADLMMSERAKRV